MQVQPYLFFDGRCEEAVDFYRKTLGAEVIMLMRFKDSPEPQPPGMVPPGAEHKIMHSRVGSAHRLCHNPPIVLLGTHQNMLCYFATLGGLRKNR